jgi:hypothetical protein
VGRDPDAVEEAFWLDVVNNLHVNNYVGMGGHSSAEARQTNGRPWAFKNFPRPLGTHDDDGKDDDDPDGHSGSFANGVNSIVG